MDVTSSDREPVQERDPARPGPTAAVGAAGLAGRLGNHSVAQALQRAPQRLPGRGMSPEAALRARVSAAGSLSRSPVGSKCKCGGTILAGGECSKCLARRMSADRALLQRDELFGQNKAIDPGDNSCTLTWTLGSGWKYLKPSGAACDPGMAGVKGSGDPLQFPYNDYPDAPSKGAQGVNRPSSCPPERWVPPSQKNGFIGHCAAPPSPPSDRELLLPDPGPEPEPGDYVVPDPNADEQVV